MTLRDYLEQEDLTVREAAAMLGWPVRTMYAYLSGARTPSRERLQVLFRWSRGLVTPNDFLGVPPNRAA